MQNFGLLLRPQGCATGP